MPLDDRDFEDDSMRQEYRAAEKYLKMSKTEGWEQLRNYVEVKIKSKLQELEHCDVSKVERIRGCVEGLRQLVDTVDSSIMDVDNIEREIKNIPQKEEEDE